MNCEQSQSLLHGYLDGELDAVRAEEFEQHLENCSQCTSELEQQEKLRASLQAARLYERAPDSVARKLHRHIVNEESDRDWSWLSILQWVGASAAIVLLAATAYFSVEYFLASRSGTLQADRSEIIDAHVRSLQPGHLTDVQSTDQHTVKPWFDGKLDFVPPVRDLGESGFPLIGGRLDVLNGRSVAALIYGRRKHVINVFVWPEGKMSSASAMETGNRNGFQWVSLRAHGMEYCAVSDVSAADLSTLAELLKE